jgi:23S rRNA A1618 N6-methylase RlmF
MLEFAEAVFVQIKRLRKESQEMILNGRVQNMEQYKFMMGRLEGFNFVEDAVQEILKKNPNL